MGKFHSQFLGTGMQIPIPHFGNGNETLLFLGMTGDGNGHLDVLAEAENALTAADCGEKDGLFLGGNYTAGVALGRCVEFGIEQADEVVAYLNAASKKAVAV